MMDYKGREISADAPSWDSGAKVHVCCNSKSVNRHTRHCGEDVEEQTPIIEVKIPMFKAGKAVENICENGHSFFTMPSAVVPCPFCDVRASRKKKYRDPRI